MENIQNADVGKKDERILVYLKVKKPLEKDKLYYNISEDKKLISLYDKVIKDESGKTQRIEVDKVFDDSEEEHNIYKELCNNCISDVLDWKNYTYISYGDSTSEKNELIIGNEKEGKKGVYYYLLNDLYNKVNHGSEFCLNLSFFMINSSILIDLSQLMGKKKYLEYISEKDLINKFGTEININDTDIIKDIRKIPCENVEENSKFISDIFNCFKKMEDAETNRFSSCSYFCFIIYIINKRTKRTTSTISFIIIPGNELLINNKSNKSKQCKKRQYIQHKKCSRIILYYRRCNPTFVNPDSLR